MSLNNKFQKKFTDRKCFIKIWLEFRQTIYKYMLNSGVNRISLFLK